ncbi:MAG: acyl-CoA dehydrogenase family protein, partial [Hyphomicrobiales bacterium]|nr:acyl-CoA dehydrogenase family protein [Hyphomicrobiales bacterium]
MDVPRADDSAPNSGPPFADVNLFAGDRPLRDAAARSGLDARALSEAGAFYGSAETMDLGRQANENPPKLRLVDPQGTRLDAVEYHPAYHALMAHGASLGLHGSSWEAAAAGGAPAPCGQGARAALVWLAVQAEAGHMCPLTMTHAAPAALAATPASFGRLAPKVAARAYDPRAVPIAAKRAVTIGMGMTERQGGSDVRANLTRAERADGGWRIDGAKWFMSAPMCDAFLVLAQAPRGLSCFLVPRLADDGAPGGIRLDRLKDKLGNRSNASAEVRFEDARGELIGEEGGGVRAIIGMVALTRFDCAVSSGALMRLGLSQAARRARARRAFGRFLVDQPAMRGVLADLALEVEAATALVFRLAQALDRAADDPAEAAYARLVAPAAKYAICKRAPAFLYEAMECQGGNGYVEELGLARAYREAPVNAIWEGSGNVIALDLLRAASRAKDETAAVLDALAKSAPAAARPLAAAIADDIASNDSERFARRAIERLAILAAAAALEGAEPALARAHAETRAAGGFAQLGAADLGGV